MKGRVVLFLFAIPFAAVGVWAAAGIGGTLHDAWRMQDWQPVEARVIDGGYRTREGEDSNTYEAYARYAYAVDGVEYTGSRVAINAGADNVGSFQTGLGRRLAAAAAGDDPVTAYYDPARPGDATLDRSIRWGLLGFKTLFFLVFGGFAAGLIIVALRSLRERDVDKADHPTSPWLRNDDWQSPVVGSGSRAAMFGAWIFAALWNVIALPLPFLLVEEVVEKQNHAALIGLIFPLVGIGLLVWAIRRTLEWRRFGAAPVTLDPFPGAIGGHVGGSIDLRLPFLTATPFRVTLTSIRSRVSGSGKNRRRTETALWQDDITATAEPGPEGTRLVFRFDVPEGLEASDADPDDRSRCIWRLNVSAELQGTDLDRNYEIPVYPTGARSTALPEDRLREARAREDRADEDRVRRQLGFEYGLTGRQMHFPPGRNAGIAMTGLLFGIVFGGAGWYLLTREDALFMGLTFGLAGFLVGLGMLYTGLNSLTVTMDAGVITARRRVLGVPVRLQSMRRDSVVRMDRKSAFQAQSGGKHVMHYKVQAVDRDGTRLTLAEGLKGEGDARAAIRLIGREFGIDADEVEAGDVGEPDILAADG